MNIDDTPNNIISTKKVICESDKGVIIPQDKKRKRGAWVILNFH